MNFSEKLKVSGQVVVVLAVLFGIHSTANAGAKAKKKFTPRYKVEKCDCLGYSDDIPTFLSDLAKADDLSQLDIYGEGKSIKDAETNAQNMCIETYRNFASVSQTEDSSSVTQSGCKKMKSTPDGDWVSI